MSNAEQPFYRRPLWIVVAIFLAVVLVGGGIAAVVGAFKSGENTTADPTSSPSASSGLPSGAAEVVRLFNMIPRERWELVMLYSAVFAALFGFLLAFKAERDGDRLTRWRASLTFAVTSTEMLTAPEAGLLLMPEEPDTGWARWFGRPKRRLVGRRLARVFPNGRSASLHFSHNAALTVADLSTATTRYQTYDYTWPARDRQDQASVILG